MNARWRTAWGTWLLAVAALLTLFNLWPGLDLAVSAALHDASDPQRFPFGRWAPVHGVYVVVPWLGRLGLVAALGLLMRGATPTRWRRRAAVMVLMLVLGLWLVVNAGLKDQWGRPRPIDVTAFGGPHPFQPAGRPSALCPSNCSFVSGHAATGFALSAIGLLGAPATRRRWHRIGWAAGLLVGLGRVLQGDHFISDVLGAGLAIDGTGLLIRHGWVLWRWLRCLRLQRQPGRVG
jgi:membrane-associated PAP2 superfamily phosphatase